MRTSPLIAWRHTLAPPRLAATPTPAMAGEVAGVTLSRSDGHLHHHQCVPPPPLSAPPPLLGSLALGEACCRSSLPASPPPPLQGSQDGLVGWLGPTPYQTIAPSPTLHSPASVVRDGVCAKHSAVSRQDFLALYERCSDFGLFMSLILTTSLGH